MKTVALYSIKGGVGKTSTAVNLAHAAAREHDRTLLWDLDPQGASTFYFRVKPKLKGGVARLLHRKRAADRFIKATDYELLDLLPADASYRYADLILDELKKPARGVRKVIKPLRHDYDYLFMDCPPSVSLLSETVFEAVDVLLVPVIPTTLSLRTLEQLTRMCESQGVVLQILPFFSMVDRRKRLHREVVEALPAERPDMLATRIPYASCVEQMGVHRAPLATFAAGTTAAAAYARLWRELKWRLGQGPPLATEQPEDEAPPKPAGRARAKPRVVRAEPYAVHVEPEAVDAELGPTQAEPDRLDAELGADGPHEREPDTGLPSFG